jgi:hypothetical protein
MAFALSCSPGKKASKASVQRSPTSDALSHSLALPIKCDEDVVRGVLKDNRDPAGAAHVGYFA